MEGDDREKAGGSESAILTAPNRGPFLPGLVWLLIGFSVLLAFSLNPSGGSGGFWFYVVLVLLTTVVAGANFFMKCGELAGGRTVPAFLALGISVALVVICVLALIAGAAHERTRVHTTNLNKFSSLLLMCSSYYADLGEYPEELAGLDQGADRSQSRPLEWFLFAEDPRSGTRLPWTYVRSNPQEFILRCEPYESNGRTVVLEARGVSGEIEW